MRFWIRGFFCMLLLSVITTLANDGCPPECICSLYVVQCVDKGLKTVPKGIKTTSRKIDLSNNPSLHIDSEYFLQFRFLFILILNNCSQAGPFYLPSKLREVHLDNNFFTGDALRKMFYHKTNLLKRLTLESNNLQPSDIKQLLEALPAHVENIDLSHNNVSELRRNDLGRFNKVKTLSLQGSSVNFIEEHALDNMTQLSTAMILDNQLTYLPDGLFRYNAKLSLLNLQNNKLRAFNATKLGLRNGNFLYLGSNSLTSVDLRETKAKHIWLSDNRLERIDKSLLPESTFIMSLALQNNNIQFISGNTFDNIKDVAQLLLYHNSIKSLPRNLFNGVSVSTMLLQENKLSSLNGVFNNMKVPPNTLILTDNRQLEYLNGSDFQTFRNTSTVYITCDQIKGIANISKINARVICSPKGDLVLGLPSDEGFACNGYQCQYIERILRYSCTACRPGYYTDCKGSHEIFGQCVKCPPGGYYQDQPASKACKTCRSGQYVPPEHSPGKDASDCQTCPKGTDTTSTAGTRACKCIYGYYRRYRFGPCEKCKDDGYDCKYDYPTLRKGYWMTWQGTLAEKSLNHTIDNNKTKAAFRNTLNCEHAYIAFINNLDITNNSYDRRTMHFTCQMPLPIKCPMSGSCIGGIKPKCSRGYTGVLCAVCRRGYKKQFNQCIECPTTVEAILQFIGCIAVFILCCVIISFTDKISIEDEQDTIRSNQYVDHRTLADILLSSLKILIGFYQIFLSIIHAFVNARWPASLKSATNILQYIQFEFIKLPSLKCINPEWNINDVTVFWITLVVIVTVPFLAVMYFLLKSLYIHIKGFAPSDAQNTRYTCGKNCTKIVALFLFVTYPTISTKIIQILPISCHSFCTAMKNDTCAHSLSYFRTDYSVPCLGMSDHKSTLIFAYFSTIIPLGLPILLLVLLSLYALGKQPTPHQPISNVIEDNDKQDDDDDCTEYFHLANIDFRADCLLGSSNTSIIAPALRFSYENYQTKYWYWEVIEMMRKLLMTVAIVLNLINTKVGITCTIVIAMMFTILHAIIKPLKSNFENAAQLLSLILIPLNLAFLAVLQSSTQSQNVISKERDCSSSGVLLVITNSILIILLLGRILVIIARKILSRITKK